MENTSAEVQHWQIMLPGGYHMFNMPWLDSSLFETLLPEKAWQKVYEKLSSAFAQEVEVHLQEPYQRQMIFQFLGEHFVHKYFSAYPNQPSLLAGPYMSVKDLENLKKTTAALLKEQCEKVAKLGHYHWESGDDYTRLSPELAHFIKDTSDTMFGEVNWVLSTYAAQKMDTDFDIESRAATCRNIYTERRTKSVDSQEVHLTTRQGSAFHLKDNGNNIIVSELRPPPMNCPESDILGKSLCAILASNPERIPTICERLKGKLLPKALRHFIWNVKLLTANKNFSKMDTIGNTEKSAREFFGQTVARKVTEMKLRSATHSAISNLVQHAVVEEYEKTPCMQVFATDEHMISETCKALNILYVFNGTYEPYLIHLLFPLQIAFRKMPPAAELPYELAMYLHLLVQYLQPSWPEVFAMAERVMELLRLENEDLYVHLMTCSARNALFDPKDFLVEVITQERKQAQELYNSPAGSNQNQSPSKEILTSPVIFLRKWMGEGFVNILDMPAVLLIWDQLFMQNWSRKVTEHFCLAILLLLKNSFIKLADDYPSMKQVFFTHACHLYTADIQRAWIHLQQGGRSVDIPGFNRLNLSLFHNPEVTPEKEPDQPDDIYNETQFVTDAESHVVEQNEKSFPYEIYFLHVPWIQHNPSTSLPESSRVENCFDLYIDAVHYIPDNASIIKVTGQILQSDISDVADILAYPLLKSQARNPRFHYRKTVNADTSHALNPKTQVLLQVYTVDLDSGSLAIIGSCLVHVFNEAGKLNAGGFQLTLRGGMQSKEKLPLTPSSLEKYHAIPCCTLLIRLLPSTQDPVPAPDYLTGFYLSDDAKPNKSEMEIIKSFLKDESFPKHVEDMAAQLMEKERTTVAADELMTWYENRLDAEKQLSLVPSLSIWHCVRYRQESGLRIRISQAFGTVKGLYVNASARIIKGVASKNFPELTSQERGNEKLFTCKLDLKSLQMSPRWIDQAVLLHPYLDTYTVLLVQLLSLDAVYTPDPSGQRPGQVTSRSRNTLQLNAKGWLKWTVIPLFDGKYVRNGQHTAPLLEGIPTPEFLDYIRSHSVKDALVERIQKKALKISKNYGSITVEIWDGHYFDDERYALPVISDLLAVGNTKKFLKTQSRRGGKTWSEFFKHALNIKEKELKENSLMFEKEKDFYEEAMANKFCSLMETDLMAASN